MRQLLTIAVCALLLLGAVGCSRSSDGPEASRAPQRLRYAIALHGGAGTMPRSMDEALKQAYLQALEGALAHGRDLLEQGRPSLDVVEQVIRRLEDDSLFNAGKGAVFNHEGFNELDASIMDGQSMACGAVAGVRTVKNPITLARRVMQQTGHVLLSGEGAQRFAELQGVDLVEPDYFYTERRWQALQNALAREAEVATKGTVGVVALDSQGNLAAGTSTGGLTNKQHGRVGDSPIIGAGTYADNRSCAVSATGKGEEFIRHAVAHQIAARVRLAGQSLKLAVDEVIGEVLAPGDGGVIAVSATGEIVMTFNTEGMYRGAADSSGRFEVAIW